MLSNALELLGVACLATFGGLIWWPIALIPVGLYLLASAYATDNSDPEATE